MRKMIIFLLLIAMISTISTALACTNKNTSTKKVDTNIKTNKLDIANSPDVKTGNVDFVESFITLEKLTNKANYIFVGEVVGESGTRNLARNSKDLSKEDSSQPIYPATDYKVKVEQFIKGKGPTELIVTKYGGEYKGIKKQFIPLKNGDRYVFFAVLSSYSGRYVSFGEPFTFKLENGEAKAESEADFLLNKYPIEKEDNFINKIRNIVKS